MLVRIVTPHNQYREIFAKLVYTNMLVSGRVILVLAARNYATGAWKHGVLAKQLHLAIAPTGGLATRAYARNGKYASRFFNDRFYSGVDNTCQP